MRRYKIKTTRLGLRKWETSDLAPATIMNASSEVMEFFPEVWDQKQTQTFIARMQAHYETYGFCYFAADLLKSNTFVGFIGLSYQTFESDFTPCVDLGWRLIPEVWGLGLATEGAKACLDFAFSELDLNEVYAIAPILNKKSQRVMQKIGMQENLRFIHPKLDPKSPLKHCVAYSSKKYEP